MFPAGVIRMWDNVWKHSSDIVTFTNCSYSSLTVFSFWFCTTLACCRIFCCCLNRFYRQKKHWGLLIWMSLYYNLLTKVKAICLSLAVSDQILLHIIKCDSENFNWFVATDRENASCISSAEGDDKHCFYQFSKGPEAGTLTRGRCSETKQWNNFLPPTKGSPVFTCFPLYVFRRITQKSLNRFPQNMDGGCAPL